MPLPLFLGIAAAAVTGAGVIKNQIEKNKEINITLEKQEIKCQKESLLPRISRIETEHQKKMRKLLFNNAFSNSEKSEQPPKGSDWKHIPNYIRSEATKNTRHYLGMNILFTRLKQFTIITEKSYS